MPNSPKPKQPLPELIEEKYVAWRQIFMSHHRHNLQIGTLAIVSSILAGGTKLFPQEGGQYFSAVCSLVAAIATALVTFYGLKDTASAYKAAWRLLDSAYRKYDRSPDEATTQGLYDAVDQGEELIRGADA